VQRFCLKICYPVTSSYQFGKQGSFHPKCGATFYVVKVGKCSLFTRRGKPCQLAFWKDGNL